MISNANVREQCWIFIAILLFIHFWCFIIPAGLINDFWELNSNIFLGIFRGIPTICTMYWIKNFVHKLFLDYVGVICTTYCKDAVGASALMVLTKFNELFDGVIIELGEKKGWKTFQAPKRIRICHSFLNMVTSITFMIT